MQDAITLAWAIKVDHTQLGARIEAYVETKAAISTLRACIAHSDVQSMSSLPPELVAMIVATLKDIVYVPKIQDWNTARRCLQDECSFKEHFTEEELCEMDYDSRYEEEFALEHRDIHQDIARAHLQKIMLPTSNDVGSQKFARYAEIFAEEFGIRPYFTALNLHSYDDYYADLESAEVSGYLAMPIVKAPIKSKPGPSNASYTVQQAIAPAIVLHGVSENTEQRFTVAMKALRLEAPHQTITVKDVNAAYEWSDDSSIGEEDVSLRVESVEKEESKTDGNKMAFGCGELDCDCVRGKRRPKLKTICLDCGRDVCQGRYTAQKPDLMMLGSGELEAYSVES